MFLCVPLGWRWPPSVTRRTGASEQEGFAFTRLNVLRLTSSPTFACFQKVPTLFPSRSPNNIKLLPTAGAVAVAPCTARWRDTCPARLADDCLRRRSVRLVALVVPHLLKGIFRLVSKNLQFHFSRTRHLLYLILYTNKHLWDPLIRFF
jgi:hypothetical protein